MRDMLKPTLALLVICFVVALCLAYINYLTKDIIIERALKDAEVQRKQVMETAQNFVSLEEWTDASGLIREVYGAYNGDELVGYVFSASPKGYAGEIKVTVGIGLDGTVTGVKIGDNKETPGLGSKIVSPNFTGQYQGASIQQPLSLVKRMVSADNEIQAISGATISSRAVTDAVQACTDLMAQIMKGEN